MDALRICAMREKERVRLLMGFSFLVLCFLLTLCASVYSTIIGMEPLCHTIKDRRKIFLHRKILMRMNLQLQLLWLSTFWKCTGRVYILPYYTVCMYLLCSRMGSILYTSCTPLFTERKMYPGYLIDRVIPIYAQVVLRARHRRREI
jgi:hypothetical protein